ncbi:amino acid adenylation domain-containing protein [Paenibacillus glucanolyticus]|uniref:non-ribosomal peptide synthetase family protein n=1 Tax=Paenibacillus glucanolyticus TaxID=59843 RepID=UPI0036C97763
MNTTLMIEQGKEYWLNELQLPLPGFYLYTDGPAHLQQHELNRMAIHLHIETDKMRLLRDSYNINTWMLTSYAVFLYRMTHDTDLLIGVNNRKGNLLPLRINLSGSDTFTQVYKQISAKMEQIELSDLSLQEIEGLHGQPISLQTVYGHAHTQGHSWLNWMVHEETMNQWILHVSYARALYQEETILKFSRHFEQLASAVIDDMDMPISQLPMLTEEDWNAYTILNDTKRDLPDNPTIVAMLASIVERFPKRIALSSDQEQMTYERLDHVSNQIAHMLISKGLRKGQFVSIFMKRGLDTIVSMLGVLKAGGAYIPLDPSHPDERNAYIIEDTKSAIILTHQNFTAKLDGLLAGFNLKPEFFCLDDQFLQYPTDSCGVQVEAEDLAYIIYTSGSTGKPKGALIAHQGVVNLALANQEKLQMDERDVILQYSTFSFDASVYDIFGSLACGSRLHLLSDEQRFSIDAFTEAVENTSATRVAILPTVFFNQLAAYLPLEEIQKYRNIKSIVVGGEALAGETVRMFQKKLQIPIVNLYGPTEITVVATGHIVDYPVPDDLATVYIGTPFANYELYIVNEHNALCPTCVTGELLISSVGVAKGYLNQPEKTKEAFIQDPIMPESGKQFYRSGDLVRLLPNGQVEYRGRKDSQVKIRGFRIEIGEIEDNLAKHESVKDIAVIPRTDEDGTKILAAFYTSNDGQAASAKELAQFLGQKVPSYMVPKYMCFLDEMPLSPTGKIDRKKLALYELSMDLEADDSQYEAPVNEIQLNVSAAWEKALGQTKISIHDDFFDIGGYSLKILEILVQLKPHYPHLKINDFFVYPTIAKLSERIEELGSAETPAELMDISGQPIQDLAEYPLAFPIRNASIGCEYTQQHILLTGATGYLGSHLLHELLRQSTATVYCLVRPSQHMEPYARLEQIMTGYFGEGVKSLMDKRVVAIQGDLEQEHLGLRIEDWVWAQQHIDSIIHCGAEVKHFGDSDYFARVNVESTDRLLTLAQSRPHIRFHFISTLGIPEDLALGGQWDAIVAGSGYEESYIENVYTNSKLEAEKLVIKAGMERGIAAAVYRVGNLSCNSESGMFQKNIDNNAFYRMLKGMLLLKKAPDVQWQVDITPINYAGEAITALVLQQETVGRVFHICNPVAISYEEMVEHFKAIGYDISLMHWKEYETWLLDPQQPKDKEGLELAMAQFEGDGAKNSVYRYTCPQTTEFLLQSGVKCAVPDQQFFRKMVNYASDIGYFVKP